MRLRSFLSRKSVPALTVQDADVLRRQVASTRALNDDLAQDLERLIRRVDCLSRQVRELSVASNGQDLHKARHVSPEVEDEDGASEIFAFIREAAEFTRP